MAGFAALAVLGLGGCSGGEAGDSEPGTTDAPATTETPPVPEDPTVPEKPTVGPAIPEEGLVEQTAPQGINGFVLVGDRIYAAAGNDDQVLAIDPETGAILARYSGFGWPDDVDVLPDGSLAVTGFQSGVLSRIDTEGKVSPLADLGAGINPVLTVSTTELLVGKALSADGLWRVNPEDGSTEPIAEKLDGVNSFDLGPDGALIGPRMGTQGRSAAVVSIDLDTGRDTDLVPVQGMPVAVEVDGDTAYVLTGAPPSLSTLDLSTPGAPLTPVTDLDFAPDNLEIAEDGTVWISSFSSPLIARYAEEKVTKLTIGG